MNNLKGIKSIRTIKKMRRITEEQIKRVKDGTLPDHKHLVKDIEYLELFLKVTDFVNNEIK